MGLGLGLRAGRDMRSCCALNPSCAVWRAYHSQGLETTCLPNPNPTPPHRTTRRSPGARSRRSATTRSAPPRSTPRRRVAPAPRPQAPAEDHRSRDRLRIRRPGGCAARQGDEDQVHGLMTRLGCTGLCGWVEGCRLGVGMSSLLEGRKGLAVSCFLVTEHGGN